MTSHQALNWKLEYGHSSKVYILLQCQRVFAFVYLNKKASIRWQDSARQLQATGQPVIRMQASDAMTSRLPRYEAKCVQRRCFQRGSVPLCVQISKERSYALPICWYHSKGNWLRYNFAADSFYIMKLCSRLLVPYCPNLYERRQI